MSATVISVLLGLFIGLMFWQIYRVFNEVPDEDRSFLDRPAFGFRLIWPLITAVEYHWGSYFSEPQKRSVYFRLRTAGKEYSIMPEQFMAAKIVTATIFAIVGFVFFSMLGKSAVVLALLAGVAGYFYPELWIKESAEARKKDILKRLPFFLDIITLAVEAGTNLTGGITQAVAKSGDSPLRSELSRVLRDIRAGKTRSESLRSMADRAGSPALVGVVSAMIQAERTGSSLGPILRAQADQIRSERFLKAEKQAMEAPVKLLGPLVMFIFPCTFFVLGFLVLSKAMLQGMISWAPLVWAYNWPG
jgi:tight adherence protein C